MAGADPYGEPPHHWQQNIPHPSDDIVSVVPKLTPPTPITSQLPPSTLYIPQPPPSPFLKHCFGFLKEHFYTMLEFSKSTFTLHWRIGSGSKYSGGELLPPPYPDIALSFSKNTFTYEELAQATDGFSNANLLGQGGFGYVHKGILHNGKEVAIKQLMAGSRQGEREFQAEVESISQVHHRHLVSLVGYCIAGNQRLIVYEFVPNNTLEFHLHGKGRPIMDWPARLKIALGAAKGLSYLHEDCHPKIIHRDIKAASILLDFKFEAKVADFGLAKLFRDANTHVFTTVVGTFGYLAPEYASTEKLTNKSDVFSFGVMLLELITGRRPIDSSNTSMEDGLVEWARANLKLTLKDQSFDSLVDSHLRDKYDLNEMARMVACAAACTRHSTQHRPRMSQVVRALEGDVALADLNEGIRPGPNSVYPSHGSSNHPARSKEDMMRLKKMALGSYEYSRSSEYSECTDSESELCLSASINEGHSHQGTREMEMRNMKGQSRFQQKLLTTSLFASLSFVLSWILCPHMLQ